jgi:hypothetical protein
MYANAKRITVETVPRIREWGIKDISEEGEFKSDIFYIYKNLCKCHNVPLPSTTIKKKIM